MTSLSLLSLAAGGMLFASAAAAADLKILTAGAFKSVIVALQPEFERESGHKLTIVNGTAGELTKMIGDGATFDVAVMPPGGIDAFTKSGQIAPGTRAVLARVGIGVMVRAGEPAPDISTVDAFKAAVLKAPTVAYIDPASGGSSGVYLTTLFDKLGIADAVKPKARLKNGGYVADLLVERQADLGIHQISEILPVKGVTLVGPIPAEIQNYTVYAGGIGAASTQKAAAQDFLKLLSSDRAQAVLAERGMERPKE